MKRDDVLLEYARTGLKAEMSALQAKLDAMKAKLDSWSGKGKKAGRGALKAAATGTEAPKGKRRKRTAAERKAVSIRMKKYWAGRREAKGKKKDAAKSADK